MKTLLINLYGGPSIGKSTTAAGVFHKLKLEGINCELALEWAKEKVWEGSEHVLSNQLYVFGKQYHRISRLLGKVDIIICDSPLLNSVLYYQDRNPYFNDLVAFEHSRLNNFDVLLQRVKPYNPAGRLQNEEEAIELDGKIQTILGWANSRYRSMPADNDAVDKIVLGAQRDLEDLPT